MLTDAQRHIVKATVPLLEAGGEALTTHFYRLMLDGHPEVRPLFNQAHQANGAQPRALANAVLRYARHIDHLENLGSLAGQIVNKHVALQILPEHYPIVGRCLLQAMGEVLGPEVATQAVIDAWAAAYQQLADLLMAAEASRYEAIAMAPGGWQGARVFTVLRRVVESREITSFYLAPTDGKPVIRHLPGQYIGLRLMVNGQEIRRNYSLSAAADGTTYRISVKREPGGVASNYLHDGVVEGTQVDLFPPSGHFTLTHSPKPLVLISGGVGITPTLAMAQAALEHDGRPVVFIHYARNAQVQGFQGMLQAWGEAYPQFRSHVVHAQACHTPEQAPDAVGYPSAEHLQAWLPCNRDLDAYLLGPTPFMAFMKRTLQGLGVPAAQTHYEFFGPAEALA